MNLLKPVLLVVLAILVLGIIAKVVAGLVKFALLVGIIAVVVWVYKGYKRSKR